MSTMPTPNRPFLGSFLAAFRVHGPANLQQKPTPSAAAAAAAASRQSTSASSPSLTASQTRSLATRAIPASATATAVAISTSQGQFSTSLAGYAKAGRGSSAHAHAAPAVGTASQPVAMPLSPLQARGRRGSDSSTDGGFRDVAAEGGGKWYIGGRTRAGEEKVYKLAMVRRPRSIDRLSLDRLSL